MDFDEKVVSPYEKDSYFGRVLSSRFVISFVYESLELAYLRTYVGTDFVILV